VKRLYKNVRCWTPERAVLPQRSCSVRSAMCSSRGENEAFLSLKELGPNNVEIVGPSLSILAEPPVSIVDKVVDKKELAP